MTAMRLERREYKYIIDEETAVAIKRMAAPFCVPDRFCRGNASYTIDSLYFDSPGKRLYLDNQHEVFDRVKLRARSYPAANHRPVFLEVKQRVGDVVYKTRGACPEPWAEVIDLGLRLDESDDAPLVSRFLYFIHRLRAEPVAYVRYEREAYQSIVDDYARVTFDRHIQCCEPDGLKFGGGKSAWRPIDHAIAMREGRRSQVVLELKFQAAATPTWMQAIVQTLFLQRKSFSKYGRSVEALSPARFVERLPAAIH